MNDEMGRAIRVQFAASDAMPLGRPQCAVLTRTDLMLPIITLFLDAPVLATQ